MWLCPFLPDSWLCLGCQLASVESTVPDKSSDPCCWAALDVPSPAQSNPIQHVNRSVSSAHPQTCLGWAAQPHSPAGQTWEEAQWGWDCDIHVTVGTFACVYTKQLTATGHRNRAWAVTDPSAHFCRLPGDAHTCTAAGGGQALVPPLMSHLQVGRGRHLALGKTILPCFVSAQNTPCWCLCTCISKTLLHDVWNIGFMLVFPVWSIH